MGAWIADNLGPAGRAGAFLADAPRRLEDLASRHEAAADERLAERLYNQPQQSRVANTTIVVIAISLTVVAILWYRWWH